MINTSKVETFGTMKKKEKTEYILEQMRLCLLKKDYVRTQIISKKIHSRILNEDGFEQLKIRFNKLMIEYYLSDRNHLEIATCYWHIYQTEKEEKAKFEVDTVSFIRLMSLVLEASSSLLCIGCLQQRAIRFYQQTRVGHQLGEDSCLPVSVAIPSLLISQGNC